MARAVWCRFLEGAVNCTRDVAGTAVDKVGSVRKINRQPNRLPADQKSLRLRGERGSAESMNSPAWRW